MQIFDSLKRNDATPIALTIGNFDGVHIGHQAILSTLVEVAKGNDWQPAAMTFSPHAKMFFSNLQDFLITSDQEKAQLIAQQGIERLFQIPFNQAFSIIDAEVFVRLLIDNLNVKFLLVGDDFRFGHKGRGDFALLSKVCAGHGVIVQHTPTINSGESRVSSSRVREVIKSARFDEVAKLLGRSLLYAGEVIKGQQLGRQIDFPTANVFLPIERLLPAGVFAVRVTLDGSMNHQVLNGMCNIGTKPTVADDGLRQIETHLFDFDGDLYGKVIAIELLEKIRDEQRFNDVAALVSQLHLDKQSALAILDEC